MTLRFFGTDGIRDVAGRGRLAPEHVARAGRALARLAAEGADGQPRVGIGRDPRPSGTDLLGLLAAALTEAGARVEDLGVLPSPATAWLVARGGYDLGVAISASHNPAEYNGIKPFARGGGKLSVEDERRVEAWMDEAAGDAPAPVEIPGADGVGRYVDATVDWLREDGGAGAGAVLVDLSAGAATTTVPPVLEALGLEAEYLHEAGSRPINERCGTEHPDAWLAALRARRGWIGAAFDGDADRVLLADEEGGLLDGHDLLAILARDWKTRGRLSGDLVVSTVMANGGLEERLASFGVRLERVAVGDRNVAQRMRETGAALGGEPSGHVVMERDGALIGDALAAGVRTLQAAARRGRSLAALRAETPRYPQLLVNVRVAERRPLEELGALAEAVREVERRLAGHGRVVVRYSGTEPLLRIMAEGRDAEEVRRAVARIERAAEAVRAPA